MDSSSVRREGDGIVSRSDNAKKLGRRVLEWLTLHDAIKRAEAGYGAGADARRFFRRGDELLKLADVELAPPDGSAPRPMVALTALREAIYWFLRAAGPGGPGDDEDAATPVLPALAARAQVTPDAPGQAFLSTHPLPVELELTHSALDESSEDRQLQSARAIQRFSHALADELNRRLFVLADLQTSRRLRLSLVALILALGLGFGIQAAIRGYLGPDVAAGKPWRASSSADTCAPARGVCAGSYTQIFFVTNEENNPWIEIDLLKPTPVRRVEVQNRRDTAAERAVPLLVELSSDGQQFFRVAQRVEPFSTWAVDFTPQLARYVRLSVPRRTTFHLERISVRS